jgi:hypothetical protein
MAELIWVIIGFLLALAWDKYKEWCRFKNSLKMMYEELNNAIISLERKFGELDGELKEAVVIAQKGGNASIVKGHFRNEPVFELMMPHGTSAWDTFQANGFLSKLDRENAEVIKDAYDTLKGASFIKGLVPSLITASLSPEFSERTRQDFLTSSRLAPLYPVIFALPKLIKASVKVETLIRMDVLSSLRYFLAN